MPPVVSLEPLRVDPSTGDIFPLATNGLPLNLPSGSLCGGVPIGTGGGGGGSWGSITGTLSSQSDLNTALNGKVPTSRTVNGHALSGNVTVTTGDLGATTIGAAMFSLTNPWAITFPRFNADNSITARSAANFRSDVGAFPFGAGTVTTPDSVSDFTVAPTATTKKALVIQARPSQTANVFEVQDSTGGNLFQVQANGDISIGGNLLEGASYLYNLGHFLEFDGTDTWAPTVGHNDKFSSLNNGTWFNNSGFHSQAGIIITNDNPDTFFSVDGSTGNVLIDNTVSGWTKLLGLPTSDPALTGQLWNLSGLVTLSGATTSNIRSGLGLAIGTNVQAYDSGLGLVKPAVAVVATSNLTLSGEQTIDGITTVTSLVLCTAQSTAANNGPWISAAGAWARPTWYATGSTTQAPQFLTTFVRLGTTYQGSTWRMTTAAVTIGTTAQTWVQTPIALGNIGGLGTGVATALGVNVGSAGAFITFNGAGGTPSSMTATNLSGTAASLNIGGSAGSLSATLAVASGGTNLTSYAIGDLLYASGSTTLSKLADVATGSVLVSGGVTTAPAYSATPTLTSLTLSGGALTLSGNQSAAAWTTSGLRIVGVAGTLTDTTSSGTVAAAYTNKLGGNTIAASSATTFTNYISSYFSDPVAGTNVTLTNKWALGADSLRIGTSNQLTISNTGVLTATSPIFTTPALTSPKITTGINDSNGNTLLGITATGSAVNYLTLTNSSTSTVGGIIGADGTGTNLSVVIAPKGSGAWVFGSAVNSATTGAMVVAGSTFNFLIGSAVDPTVTGNYIGFRASSVNVLAGDMQIYDGYGGNRKAIWGSDTSYAIQMCSGGGVGMRNSTSEAYGTPDLTLFRAGAGFWGVGTTDYSTINGSIKALTFIPAGTATTCTGATIGTGSKSNAGFVTATTTGTSTIVITFPVTAPTGWNISASDSTAVTNMVQTASTTTTATLSGTTVSGDVIRYVAFCY